MTPTSLIIVTDRGSLKAYRVNETPTRGPSLQLVQAFNITDALIVERVPLPSAPSLQPKPTAAFRKSWPIKSPKLSRAMGRKAGPSPRRRKFTRQSSICYLQPCATGSSNM
jgi:hypothetical protein